MTPQPTTAIPLVDRLPQFADSYVRAVPELAVPCPPQAMPAPVILALQEDLADELGLDPTWLRTPDGIAHLTAHTTPQPHALAYAGHQFGRYSPQLGDGRAHLVGELVDTNGRRVDLHVKGSGRTPFARGGDGNAELGPMLREYLFAEAMHALDIPTTRALAVLTTGAAIRAGVPGAVVVRTAASHLRVGTFEFAARFEDATILERLTNHAIDRHHPDVRAHDVPALGLLAAVVEAQAALVAQWMLVGFIHGVLNTDNVLIAAETIDFGPCAFMDVHDPDTVFSSIDRGGRYAYGNQPTITRWNLTRLAETLLPLISDDLDTAVAAATEVLHTFDERHQTHWLAGMRRKLGLRDEQPELCGDLVDLLTAQRVDHTSAFRALASWLRGEAAAVDGLLDQPGSFDDWLTRWQAAVTADGRDPAEVAAAMDRANPVHIPRNHLVDEALRDAEAGDMARFHSLLAAVTDPFDASMHDPQYALPAPADFTAGFQTFCGT